MGTVWILYFKTQVNRKLQFCILGVSENPDTLEQMGNTYHGNDLEWKGVSPSLSDRRLRFFAEGLLDNLKGDYIITFRETNTPSEIDWETNFLMVNNERGE